MEAILNYLINLPKKQETRIKETYARVSSSVKMVAGTTHAHLMCRLSLLSSTDE